ncbi:hypothetical protein Fmac_031611 [Flemingia macrophylla]|uniref:Uncharacterized protein n=1 Tax=Flemingia macrophylla TaxID=520843 RepID=A0ABD1L3W4_9FABA
MLWVQSCASFSEYYHYHHQLLLFPTEAQPHLDFLLPCLPLLRREILGQFSNLEKPFCILMDTFQDLEPEVVEYMSNICPIKTVGPLFMATYSSVHVLLRGDFLKTDHSIMDWLHSKEPSSVVYISFSSVWEEGESGAVVPARASSWSPLCGLLHDCGWNSSMEALSFGVPLVEFPQWGDQVTNASTW